MLNLFRKRSSKYVEEKADTLKESLELSFEKLGIERGMLYIPEGEKMAGMLIVDLRIKDYKAISEGIEMVLQHELKKECKNKKCPVHGSEEEQPEGIPSPITGGSLRLELLKKAMDKLSVQQKRQLEEELKTALRLITQK